MEQFISPHVLLGDNENDKLIHQHLQQQQHQQHQQQQQQHQQQQQQALQLQSLPGHLNPQNFQQQTAAGFDFSSFASPSDILAPSADLFESELDSSLAGFDPTDLQSLIDNEPDAFAFFRTETPTCGPPSTFTVSSESAYETLSSYSESIYNHQTSELSLPLNFDMEFARASISAAHSDYGSHQQFSAAGLDFSSKSEYAYGHGRSSEERRSPTSTSGVSSGQIELSSSSSSPISGPNNVGNNAHNGSVYSGYGNNKAHPPVTQHPSLAYNAALAAAGNVSLRSQQAAYAQQPQARSPSPVGVGLSMSLLPRITRTEPSRTHIRHPSSQGAAVGGFVAPQLPGELRNGHGHAHHVSDLSPVGLSNANGTRGEGAVGEDARKKHRCPQCARCFARAYNLKTHMQTHDPHRQKQYSCTHANCDRSFSRKHDLGRHLVAIHRDDPEILKTTHGIGSGEGGNGGGSECGSAYSHRSIGVAAGKLARCDKCGASGPKRCACKAK